MNPKYFILLFNFLFFSSLTAQKIDFSGEINLKGLGANDEESPFWMYHNTRGRITENTNLATWISGRSTYHLTDNAFIEVGAGFLYRDGTLDNFFIDESYLHFENSWMHATVGRKQRPELYNGLSASHRSILWSINARPLPGIQIGTTRPVFLFSENRGLGFEASWEEYLMGEDRHVDNARLHHKNLLLVYRFNNEWQLKAGFQHFVQWAGTSSSRGKQPQGFKDYLRIIAGKEGGEDAAPGDQLNALGNHVGGYEIYLSKGFPNFKIQLFYNHLFEDGTGTRLVNTPDGRYGIYIQSKDENKLVNSFIYEMFFTQHQSHTTIGIHKYDNYFNNGVYSSGWTYEGRVIGAPFFTVDPEDPKNGGIINNKFRAHHIGIGGQFSNNSQAYPYKLMLSYALNDGIYNKQFNPKQDVFYADYKMRVWQKFVEVNLQLGAEYNTYSSPIYGVGVHLKKRF